MAEISIDYSKEIWKDVVGYEGLYQVSSSGNIKSKKNKTKNLKPLGKTQRYLKVRLYTKNGKWKSYAVHRLVAEAFLSNPDKKPQVNHIDGDKNNNKATNLEWCTASENSWHAIHVTRCKVMCAFPKRRVVAYNECYEIYFNSMAEAAKHGFQPAAISGVIKGKHKQHAGYKWRDA